MKKLFFISAVVMIFGCQPKIIQFTNDNAQFSNYESFWVVNYKSNDPRSSAEGAKIMGNIRSQIQDQMERRNYSITPENPDLLVRYELISNQVTEVDRTSGAFYPRGYYYPDQFFRTRTYLESALLIEITDQNTKKLVWQASTDLNKFARKKNDEDILRNAINQLFNTYLYRAGSGKPDETLIVES